jgi:hypothetical protein
LREGVYLYPPVKALDCVVHGLRAMMLESFRIDIICQKDGCVRFMRLVQ